MGQKQSICNRIAALRTQAWIASSCYWMSHAEGNSTRLPIPFQISLSPSKTVGVIPGLGIIRAHHGAALKQLLCLFIIVRFGIGVAQVPDFWICPFPETGKT